MCRVVLTDVSERKHLEAQIKGKMNHLEIFNSNMIGRELRMVELKKEINTLLKAAGKPEKFPGGCLEDEFSARMRAVPECS